MPETAHKRQPWLTLMVYATPLMTPTTALGLSIRLSMFELCETGDWDIFLGPPERTRAEMVELTNGCSENSFREIAGLFRMAPRAHVQTLTPRT